MDPTRSCEVVILGGGPAGATAAALLASWGHDVVLVAGRRRSFPLAETLPPSARSVLERTELLDAVERAGFIPARGTTLRWADRPDATRFGEPAGWQIPRDRLDALLLERAEAAGVHVLRETVAGALEPGDGTTRGRATLASRSGAREIAARWIVDATGRAGLLADHAGRRTGAPTTVAFAALWRADDDWALADPTDTTVESYEGGWIWSIPLAQRVRCVAVMASPAALGAAPGTDPTARQRAELARSELHRRLLERAAPASEPWICGATAYDSARCAGPGWIAIGDAGSFLDPLSSYGVKKALSSAWLGAVVLHTALIRPEMTAAALELHDVREREAAAHFRRLTARFDALAAEAHGGEFWTDRAARSAVNATGGTASDEGGDALAPDPRALLADPAVRRAFEQLRATERVRLRPAAGLRRLRAPAVRGREVVLEDRVAAPDARFGLGMLRGVDLPALVDSARTPADVPELMEAYARSRGPVPLPDLLAGLSVLLANGVLENDARAG